MDFQEAQEVLREWAAARPYIRRVYAFGSRVGGTHRPDSDLDVAYEFDEAIRAKVFPGDSDAYTTSLCQDAEWARELEAALSVPVDLEGLGKWPAPHLRRFVREGGVLVYEKPGATGRALIRRRTRKPGSTPAPGRRRLRSKVAPPRGTPRSDEG